MSLERVCVSGVPHSDRSHGVTTKARWPWRARLWLLGVQERSGSDVSHPRDAAGVPCAWSNLESDLVGAVSGHGNGVTADGCPSTSGMPSNQTLPSPNGRPPLSERQAWEDGGTTCSPDLSLSAACRAKGPRVREPLQDLIPDFWRREPMGGRPAPPCLAHVSPALRSQRQHHRL